MTYDEIKDKLVDNFSVREKLINITDQTDTRPGNELNCYLGGEPIEVQYNDTSFTVKEWYIESPNKQVHQSGYYAQVFSIEYRYINNVDEEVTLTTQWYKEGDLITPPEGVNIYDSVYTSTLIREFISWTDLPHTMTKQNIISLGNYKKVAFRCLIYVDGVELFDTRRPIKVGSSVKDHVERYMKAYRNPVVLDKYPELMPEYDISVKIVQMADYHYVHYYVNYDFVTTKHEVIKYREGEQIIPYTPEPIEHRLDSTYVYKFRYWKDEATGLPLQEKMGYDDIIAVSFYELVIEPESEPESPSTRPGVYTINWYVDGVIVHSELIKDGDKITVPSIVYEAGKTVTITSEVPETMPSHDIDIHATTWTNYYIIKYYVYDELVFTVDYAAGEEVDPTRVPDQRQYHSDFIGWEVHPSYMPPRDITISAIVSDEMSGQETPWIPETGVYMSGYQREYLTIECDYDTDIYIEDGTKTSTDSYYMVSPDKVTWTVIPDSTSKYSIEKNKPYYIKNGGVTCFDNRPLGLIRADNEDATLKTYGSVESLFCDYERVNIFGCPDRFIYPFSRPYTGEYYHDDYVVKYNAQDLILPWNVLRPNCYESAFEQIAVLLYAPSILPATHLAKGCYKYMFKHCGWWADYHGLNNFPILPAKKVMEESYYGMFEYASFDTALDTHPKIELPATQLSPRCYAYMFHSFNWITIFPKLPAKTLAEECYAYMFATDTMSTMYPDLVATTLADKCYDHMFWKTRDSNHNYRWILHIYVKDDVTANPDVHPFNYTFGDPGSFQNVFGIIHCYKSANIPKGYPYGYPSNIYINYLTQ